jgi:hypothetical protein
MRLIGLDEVKEHVRSIGLAVRVRMKMRGIVWMTSVSTVPYDEIDDMDGMG